MGTVTTTTEIADSSTQDTAGEVVAIKGHFPCLLVIYFRIVKNADLVTL